MKNVPFDTLSILNKYFINVLVINIVLFNHKINVYNFKKISIVGIKNIVSLTTAFISIFIFIQHQNIFLREGLIKEWSWLVSSRWTVQTDFLIVKMLYYELALDSVTSCHLPFTIIKLIPLVFDR